MSIKVIYEDILEGSGICTSSPNPIFRLVKAEVLDGYNMSIAQFWGSGPKLTLRCGDCSIDFKARIVMVNHPRVACPHCDAVNIVPIKVDTGE